MDAPEQMQSDSKPGKYSIQTADGTSHTMDLKRSIMLASIFGGLGEPG